MTVLRVLVVMLLVTVHVCYVTAEDEAPAAQIDMPLFQYAGASWSYRHLSWTRGGPPVEWHSSHRFDHANEDAATIRFNSPNHPQRNQREGTLAFDLKYPPQYAVEAAKPGQPREDLVVEGQTYECIRVRITEPGVHITSWVSVQYFPLVVKESRVTATTVETRIMTGFRTVSIDPHAVFRVLGRSWTHRAAFEIDGMEPFVSMTRHEVVSLSVESATVRMTTLDGDGEPVMESTDYEIEFPEVWQSSGIEPERKEITTPAGTFRCVRYVDEGPWMSEVYAGMLVRHEAEDMVMELYEFSDGHDPKRFYRTVGNYYVEHHLQTKPFRHERFTRYEVIEVSEDSAKARIVEVDRDGDPIGRPVEFDVAIDEMLGQPGAPYEELGERVIDTPAGRFACKLIEYENQDARAWRYLGLTMRAENNDPMNTYTSELIELSIE